MGDLKRNTEQRRQLGFQTGTAESRFLARRRLVKQWSAAESSLSGCAHP